MDCISNPLKVSPFVDPVSNMWTRSPTYMIIACTLDSFPAIDVSRGHRSHLGYRPIIIPVLSDISSTSRVDDSLPASIFTLPILGPLNILGRGLPWPTSSVNMDTTEVPPCDDDIWEMYFSVGDVGHHGVGLGH